MQTDIFARRLTEKTPLSRHAATIEGYFSFPKLEGPIGPRMGLNGREMVCWSLNNYLGLSNHPEVREADAAAAAEYGMGYPMGSRLMSGDTELHDELERQLSEFVGKEATMLLNFGYQGAFSIVDALLDRHDAVVYDKDVHACTYDGIRMQTCHRFSFRNNDLAHLEKQLIRATEATEKSGGGILVLIEGVYGMGGHQGKVAEVVALKEKYNFRLLLDDAHGFGVLGETGAGTGEAQGCQDGVDLYYSTFTKSMSTMGAFISGGLEILEHMKYTVRSQVFSKTIPMPVIVGALKRLDMIRTRPELRERLWKNVHSLQAGLYDHGFLDGNILGESCITPVFLKHDDYVESVAMVCDLRDAYGIFTSIMVYPVVPKGTMMLRLTATALHTERDIDETLHGFTKVREKLAAGFYSDALNDGPIAAGVRRREDALRQKAELVTTSVA